VIELRVCQRLYSVLLVGFALALFALADFGRAARERPTFEQPTIGIVASDLAGHRTALTHDPGWDVNPAVARDGRVAFFSDRAGVADLFVMDAGGGDVRGLTNGAAGVALGEDLEWSQASWSPQSDRIAFDGLGGSVAGPGCMHDCAGWDVFVVGVDGSGLEHVALNARRPAWSPDGARLAYNTYDESGGTVTITRLDGSGSVTIKGLNASWEVGPVWSPRGDRLAFQATPPGRSSTWVYSVHGDGTGERRLAQGQNASWSPDGRQLAFVDDCRLYTIHSDGTHRRQLSRKGEFVADAAWSPRDTTIAYTAGSERTCSGAPTTDLRLETTSADGTRPHTLMQPSPIASGPVWTPDGKRILVAVG
jgi:Tol biopolymer transport system component